MKYKADLKLHNRYDVFVKNVITGEEKQVAYAENIILDGLWARLIAALSNAYGTHINYGTGAGTLSASRSTMFSYLGFKAGSASVYTLTPTHISRRTSIVLLENEHVGQTLTEVGLSAGSTTIYTHAVLRDMNGNPVSLLKKDTDIITIYATVYLVFPEAGWYNGSVVFQVKQITTIPQTIRRLLGEATAFNTGTYDFYPWHQRIPTDGYTGVSLGSAYISQTYNIPNKKIIWYGRLPANTGNVVTGFGSVSLYELGGQVIYMKPSGISGDWHGGLFEVIGEAIATGDGTTTDFTTKFPFIQSDAVVKVNGTPVSVTIMDNCPNQRDISHYMECVETHPYTCLPNLAFSSYAGPYYDGYWENPFYQTFGIDSVYLAGYLYTSDDNVNWTLAASRASTSAAQTAIPSEHQHKRYWKGVRYGQSWWCRSFTSAEANNFKNIRFASPPAVGAVITADYKTKVIPKDVNHIFDLTIEFTLAEYVP